MATLDTETRARLLRMARSAINADLFGGAPPDLDNPPWPPLGRRGVFVTLWKGDRLRGCIGTFCPHADLPETVREMAVAAAHDPRFVSMPIGAAEMDAIRIDLSILSPLQRVDDPLSLEIGRHGIFVRQGMRSGCFLPDVAVDRGWDQKTFLSQCCQQKAGLDSHAWQDPRTEVSVFTVDKIVDEGTSSGRAGSR